MADTLEVLFVCVHNAGRGGPALDRAVPGQLP
jgi:hypothetical protein